MHGENNVDAAKVFYLMVALTSAVLIYLKYNMTYWKRRGVHYLKPNLLLGNVTDLLWDRKPSGLFLKEMHENGDGHRFIGMWTFQTPALVIRDPSLIREILVKEFDTFCDRASGGDGESDTMGRKNLFFGNNPDWRFLRTKLTPSFTGKKLRYLFLLIQEANDKLKNYLQEDVGANGKIVELKSTYDKYSIDVIVSCAFGIQSNALRDKNCLFRELAEAILSSSFERLFTITVYIMMPKLIDIFRLRLFGKRTEFARDVFLDSLKERERSKVKRGDIVDGILEIRESSKNGPRKMEGDALASVASIVFAAGISTTSSTISFALYYLAVFPEIQERARAEALAVKEKYREFNYDSLSKLKYIENIIQERTFMKKLEEGIVQDILLHGAVAFVIVQKD